MNEFFARWETESPAFFKRLGKFGKWVVGVGVALGLVSMAAPAEVHAQVVSIVKTVAGYMVFGGGIIMAMAGLPVNSHSELEKKMNKSKNENPVD